MQRVSCKDTEGFDIIFFCTSGLNVESSKPTIVAESGTRFIDVSPVLGNPPYCEHVELRSDVHHDFLFKDCTRRANQNKMRGSAPQIGADSLTHIN